MPEDLPDEPVTPAPVPTAADAADDAAEPPVARETTPPVATGEAVPEEVATGEVVPEEVVTGEAVPEEAVPAEGVPDEETLARIATPALVRRAPRFGAFIGYGAVLGFVLGVVLAIALDRGDLVAAGEGGGVLPFLAGSNGARLVTGIGLAGVGAIVGAALALWADARSRRAAR